MATAIDLVVDTSALTAILFGEPDAAALLGVLSVASCVGLCAPNRTEFLVVTQARLGDRGVERAKQFMIQERVLTVPLDEALADLAAEGFRRFGKGRHPAGLNYGDCFSYALATRERVPLLFKGDDFSKSDVGVARMPAL